MTGKAADAAQAPQCAWQLLETRGERCNFGEIALNVREAAVARAGLARRVTRERALGRGERVVPAEILGERSEHRVLGEAPRDRLVTIAATTIERRLVVAARVELEPVPVRVADRVHAAAIGDELREVTARAECRARAVGAGRQTQGDAGEEHSVLERNVG
jgi:hypothetical protein